MNNQVLNNNQNKVDKTIRSIFYFEKTIPVYKDNGNVYINISGKTMKNMI